MNETSSLTQSSMLNGDPGDPGIGLHIFALISFCCIDTRTLTSTHIRYQHLLCRLVILHNTYCQKLLRHVFHPLDFPVVDVAVDDESCRLSPIERGLPKRQKQRFCCWFAAMSSWLTGKVTEQYDFDGSDVSAFPSSGYVQ